MNNSERGREGCQTGWEGGYKREEGTDVGEREPGRDDIWGGRAGRKEVVMSESFQTLTVSHGVDGYKETGLDRGR